MHHFRGVVYRAHNPAWSFSPVSGEGAKRYGGRFNPVGVPALYTALTETVAVAEYQQGFPHRPQPVTLCAYDVDCADIADLTDIKVCRDCGIDPSDLGCAWELLSGDKQMPPSWLIHEKLTRVGVAGIVVPSYAKNSPDRGRNLVFWKWGPDIPNRVVVIDDRGRLPKNQESWR